MRNTVQSFLQAKMDKRRLALLTAYDYGIARLVDASGIDGILVGDSVGMVSLGYETTLPVTMEEMIHHCRAVSRGVRSALLVADMPFMSYQVSVQEAVHNAGRLIKEGNAHAVKLEGGEEVAEQVRAIVNASIPVMGHIGMTPQSVNIFGGFKVQGKGEESARKIMRDAKAVEEAGAFSVVMECMPARLATLVTESLSIPTIGIGAGAGCDGQVLVWQDMLGIFQDFTPKFVKTYANLGPQIREAFAGYVKEVRDGTFPASEHSFEVADEVLEKLY